jgi:hypothetical protein
MKDLIDNATIIYENGFKRICKFISITEKGIYTGNLKSFGKKVVFVNSGFIPINQIKKIMAFKEDGEIETINF